LISTGRIQDFKNKYKISQRGVKKVRPIGGKYNVTIEETVGAAEFKKKKR
jgi:hypothetical protein